MRTLYQLYVEPERLPDKEQILSSGIIIPAVGGTFDPRQRQSRNELRPLQGTVISSPIHGFLAMHDERSRHSKNFAMVTDGARPGSGPAAMMQTGWRMPKEGDEVWFGFMSWQWGREPNFMWPGEIYWVEPKDGEPYALGDWCIVEQVSEEVERNGLVMNSAPGTELGRGVVLAVGDGFAEAMPNVRPGMTIRFKVFGQVNPEVRNPFGGKNATRLRPSQVVAVESSGITIGEARERDVQADRIVKEAARLGNITVLDPTNDQEDIKNAQEDLHRKQWKDRDRRYHGKRMIH